MAKKFIPPGPRDARGVLAAKILAAAREAFAETGWAGTTIRAVARAADVDPALVYHYFGNKDGLLDAATNPPQRWLQTVAKTWATPVPELGTALLRLMLGAWADDEIGHLMGVSQLGVDERDRTVRSGLVSSQLMGLAMMRYIWKIEPLASMSDDELVAAIAPNLRHYIEGEIR
jgi:AcrR family transcriptional regulator